MISWELDLEEYQRGKMFCLNGASAGREISLTRSSVLAILIVNYAVYRHG
jgi:hypothetical protein